MRPFSARTSCKPRRFTSSDTSFSSPSRQGIIYVTIVGVPRSFKFVPISIPDFPPLCNPLRRKNPVAFSGGIRYNEECKPQVARVFQKIDRRNLKVIDKSGERATLSARGTEERAYVIWRAAVIGAPPQRPDPGAVCRAAAGVPPGGEQVGVRSFP